MKTVPGIQEPRPCMVKTYANNRPSSEAKALFHRFITRAAPIPPAIMRGGHPGGQSVAPYALIELENGQVYEVEPRDIRFLDTKAYMDQYAWDAKMAPEVVDKRCNNCKHFMIGGSKEPCRSCERVKGEPTKWEAAR